MGLDAGKWARGAAGIAAAGLILAAGLAGCGRQTPAGAVGEAEGPPAVKEAQGADTATAAGPGTSADPRWQQTFAEATRAEPPEDWPRPPDTTAAGKSTGRLYTDVVRLWPEVRFVSAAGRPVEYTAVLETDQGTVEIALRHDWAPNHVRNFVALARAGYYDGLVFERIIHQESDVEKGAQLDLIEGGSPLGAEDPDYDGIGYWLKAEADAKVRHEEGTVGAARGEDMDTAACKFYIITSPPPETLNGSYTAFGKVTRGLDVARKIHGQPYVVEDEDGGYHRPEKPVVIRKVTIEARERDGAVASVGK